MILPRNPKLNIRMHEFGSMVYLHQSIGGDQFFHQISHQSANIVFFFYTYSVLLFFSWDKVCSSKPNSMRTTAGEKSRI